MADAGKYATTTYDGDGVTKNFAIGFPYVEEGFVTVTVDGAVTVVNFTDGGTTVEIDPAPPTGSDNVVILRDTDTDIPSIPSQQPVSGATLVDQSTRMFHKIEEAHDLVS